MNFFRKVFDFFRRKQGIKIIDVVRINELAGSERIVNGNVYFDDANNTIEFYYDITDETKQIFRNGGWVDDGKEYNYDSTIISN